VPALGIANQWLDRDVRPRMHAYPATICHDLGADLVCVGGVADHAYIVTTLPRTVSQAQLVDQIKKTSSKWIKALDARYRGFFWQRGYGAFSATRRRVGSVVEYVNKQREHHRRETFQEEYRELLRKHRVDFDERYAWD
jgi:putative transposase